ncbi:hypothetical protein ABIF38_003038 [Bradyrhizobium japonicum]|jgi:hypothetical protein|uniref:Uncharacterized protein n=1 Tax=Bradyrhizobium elkanii TaxID=29448 RepID=A0ABV4FCH6_BRAEL|nr:hypothetical protein [Bradyrhizobium elkanii]MBP2431722.1 hypothetical protein [Bradyrhizobium elkanii]MCP1734646.1 hypothetical protein [Bradyrhizobium elkanii]MCP1752749.1 hypothetical protein [Bradyrhizobium elkanii]MCP1966384.1 hypothetical protein [Bradyrhizobium elkanii]MCS3522548.1 hypothetical protein [Bradyrhizobium elkanii]
MNESLTLAELRTRLDRLGNGAVLRISDRDYERLFGINEVAAAKAAQFARKHHCVSVPGEGSVYFRKSNSGAYGSVELVQDVPPMSR